MKTEYKLIISSDKATAEYKLVYSNGYFQSLSKLNGKVTDKQHKYLMNFAPILEKMILFLQEDWKCKGIKWEPIEKVNTQTLHKTMLDDYYSWYKEKFKLVPKINGIEQNALKEIIKHLSRMASTELEIIEAWNTILSNWDELPDFYKSQSQLRQINQYLNNILRAIKNESKKSKYER